MEGAYTTELLLKAVGLLLLAGGSILVGIGLENLEHRDRPGRMSPAWLRNLWRELWTRKNTKPIAVVFAVMLFGGCATLDKIKPVETACAFCAVLEGSGVCDQAGLALAVPCEEGETLHIANLDEVLDEGAPIAFECRGEQ